MIYRALADLVVLTHLAFIAFAIFGGLLALRWRWVPWAHLPAVAWGAAVALFGWVCLLTPLENWLRRGSAAQSYSGGFIEQYLMGILYPPGLSRGLQIGLALLLIVINGGIYLAISGRRRRRGVTDDRSSH